jgi:hypothetical protein
MADSKSNLERGIEIVSKVCTILIPVVLFYFGNQFKQAQDAEIKEQQNYNRITTLLKSLSSENVLERKLAIEFSKDLANAGNFPLELLSVMDEVSATDTNASKDAQAVINIVSEKAKTENNTAVEEIVKEVVKSSRTKIYLQIPKGYNDKSAVKLMNGLKSEGFNVLGIERVDVNKTPKNNEIRYFKDSDHDNAINISESIIRKGINVKVQRIRGFENKINGSQLEIWLNTEAINLL